MPTPTQQKPQTVNRVYQKDLEIDSDTFKLEVANFAKNVSFDDKKPLLVPTPHCHYFHTYDSNGKKMHQCNAVGGHNHDVSIKLDKNGDMIGECGPAKTNKPFNDSHVHEIIYMKSDKFKVRSLNEKAQQVIANYSRI